MSQLITVLRSDSKIQQYLDGSFSKEKRALIEASQKESVTFRLVNNADINPPHFVEIILKLLRPRYWTYSLGPTVAAGIYTQSKVENWNLMLVVYSLLGVVCFHNASLLFKEYRDHINGKDHVRWKGSQVIQNGWVSAKEVLLFSYISLLLAIVCATFTLIQQPLFVGVIGVSSLIAARLFITERVNFPGKGELIVFLMSGPLAVLGFSYALFSYLDNSLILLSLVFGLLSAFGYYLRCFEEIVTSSQREKTTIVGRLGFDRSRLWAKRIPWLQPCFFVVFGVLSGNILLWSIMAVVLCIPVLYLYRSIDEVQSCLSSRLPAVRREGVRLHFICSALVALALEFTIIYEFLI